MSWQKLLSSWNFEHSPIYTGYCAVFLQSLGMSRSKEYQERLNLQAKLQSAFSNNTAAVLGWLKELEETDRSEDRIDPGHSKQSDDHTELEDSKKAFLNFPSCRSDLAYTLARKMTFLQKRTYIRLVSSLRATKS